MFNNFEQRVGKEPDGKRKITFGVSRGGIFFARSMGYGFSFSGYFWVLALQPRLLANFLGFGQATGASNNL